jgi:hypothetical protein
MTRGRTIADWSHRPIDALSNDHASTRSDLVAVTLGFGDVCHGSIQGSRVRRDSIGSGIDCDGEIQSRWTFIRTAAAAGSSGKLQKELDLGYFKDPEVFPFFFFLFSLLSWKFC